MSKAKAAPGWWSYHRNVKHHEVIRMERPDFTRSGYKAFEYICVDCGRTGGIIFRAWKEPPEYRQRGDELRGPYSESLGPRRYDVARCDRCGFEELRVWPYGLCPTCDRELREADIPFHYDLDPWATRGILTADGDRPPQMETLSSLDGESASPVQCPSCAGPVERTSRAHYCIAAYSDYPTCWYREPCPSREEELRTWREIAFPSPAATLGVGRSDDAFYEQTTALYRGTAALNWPFGRNRTVVNKLNDGKPRYGTAGYRGNGGNWRG